MSAVQNMEDFHSQHLEAPTCLQLINAILNGVLTTEQVRVILTCESAATGLRTLLTMQAEAETRASTPAGSASEAAPAPPSTAESAVAATEAAAPSSAALQPGSAPGRSHRRLLAALAPWMAVIVAIVVISLRS